MAFNVSLFVKSLGFSPAFWDRLNHGPPWWVLIKPSYPHSGLCFFSEKGDRRLWGRRAWEGVGGPYSPWASPSAPSFLGFLTHCPHLWPAQLAVATVTSSETK